MPGFAKLRRGAERRWSTCCADKAPLDFPNDWWFWNASRVIPDTINEFPFFTFIYADLHAHMIALPLTLLALAAVVGAGALQCVPRRRVGRIGCASRRPGASRLPELLPIVLLGFVVGALRATNTWDFPTYALAGLAGAGRARGHPARSRARGGPARWHPGVAGVPASGRVVSVIWRFIILLARRRGRLLPVHQHYATAYAGLRACTRKPGRRSATT